MIESNLKGNINLNDFENDKKEVRSIIGKIGGTVTTKKDKILTRAFILLLMCLFIVDILENIFHQHVPLMSTEFTMILAVLLVSIKIIWMMHKQAKLEHFQFWILNSLEYRLNDVSKRIKGIEKNIKDLQK